MARSQSWAMCKMLAGYGTYVIANGQAGSEIGGREGIGPAGYRVGTGPVERVPDEDGVVAAATLPGDHAEGDPLAVIEFRIGYIQQPLEAAAMLRASPLDRFTTVAAPLAARGFLTASVLSFAHTLGEFGVVLMVGGNIPGKTKVISIAIYEHVETINHADAHVLSAILLAFSFAVLLLIYVVNRRFPEPAV